MKYMMPLLSVRALPDFSPAEFKAHISSFFNKPLPRAAPPKVSWRKTKTGKVSVSVRRKPKWITEEEMNQISQESGIPLNELFIYLKKRKIEISTQNAEK